MIRPKPDSAEAIALRRIQDTDHSDLKQSKIDDFELRELTPISEVENINTNQIGKKKPSAFDIYLKSKGKWSGVYRRLADS